jgi:hypothetical protein
MCDSGRELGDFAVWVSVRKEDRMAEAMEKVLELFRAKEWSYELDEENHLVRSGINGDNGEWKVVISPSDEDELCLMLSIFP